MTDDAPPGAIGAEWDQFAAMTLPPDTSAEDLLAGKTHFFAGAASLFTLLMRAVQEDEDPDDFMARVEAEIDAFAASLPRDQPAH